MNLLFDVSLKHRLVRSASKESNTVNVNTFVIKKNIMISDIMMSLSDQVIISHHQPYYMRIFVFRIDKLTIF